VIKVDINKSTDEFVFQTDLVNTKSHHHHHQQQQHINNQNNLFDDTLSSLTPPTNQHDHDLNSTVLDSEDILSTYSSTVIQQSTIVQIGGGGGHSPRNLTIQRSGDEPMVIVIENDDLVAPESINELVNVADVLSDVTHSLVNQAQIEAASASVETKANKENSSAATAAPTSAAATSSGNKSRLIFFF
jgi:hypothetical protein